MLRDQINEAMKDAMRSQNKLRLGTLRLVSAAIKNADIEARGQGKEPLNEAELMSLFQKMIKQRHESADLYEKGGRPELAAQEKGEIPPDLELEQLLKLLEERAQFEPPSANGAGAG